MTVQRFILLVLLLAAVTQAAYYYPRMPPRMASHFDAAGRPDGWTPKDGFFLVYALVVTLMSAIFAVVPRFVFRLPDSMINLPNKGYWLATERREQTREMIERHMNAAGNLTMALLLCIFQMTFRVNLEKETTLPEHMGLLVVAFVALMLVWCVRFVRAFRMPQDRD